MLVNRHVRCGKVRTSVRLEPFFSDCLDEVCRREGIRVGDLIQRIDERIAERGLPMGRTEAIRAFLLSYFYAAATESGHVLAGHGEAARETKRRPLALPVGLAA